MQAPGGQLIEVTGVEVYHPGRRGRRRLQGDEIVLLVAAQQLPSPVPQPDVEARIVHGIVVALEEGGGFQHLRQQLGHHGAGQTGVAQHGAGRDAGAKPDDQGRIRPLAVDQQRQQGLQPHVAQRRHGIPCVRDPLNVETLEAAIPLSLGDDGHSAPLALMVVGKMSASGPGQQLGQPLWWCERAEEERHQRHGKRGPGQVAARSRALPGRNAAKQGRQHGQECQGTHQAKARDEQEAGQGDPGDAPQGVEGHQGAHVPTYLRAGGRQPQGQWKGGAEQCGGEEDGGEGHGEEAGTHAGQLVAGHLQGPELHLGLGHH
ncbi:hypothetical protein D3C72_620260 [compost metagenome]